jgi:hypothetical protein
MEGLFEYRVVYFYEDRILPSNISAEERYSLRSPSSALQDLNNPFRTAFPLEDLPSPPNLRCALFIDQDFVQVLIYKETKHLAYNKPTHLSQTVQSVQPNSGQFRSKPSRDKPVQLNLTSQNVVFRFVSSHQPIGLISQLGWLAINPIHHQSLLDYNRMSCKIAIGCLSGLFNSA